MLAIVAISIMATERTVVPDRIVFRHHAPITGIYQGASTQDRTPLADWPTFEWIGGRWLFGNSASYFVPTDPLEDVCGMLAEPGTHALEGNAPPVRIVGPKPPTFTIEDRAGTTP